MRSGRLGALMGLLAAAAAIGGSSARASAPVPKLSGSSGGRWRRTRRRDTKPAFDPALRKRRNKIAARSRLVNRRKAA